MIIFNGKKYAANDNEFTNSLFEQGSTCNGFYKRTKNGFRLYNIQHELIAFIRCIKEPMLMSADEKVLKKGNKIWYSYTSDATNKYLGIVCLIQEFNAVDALVKTYWK